MYRHKLVLLSFIAVLLAVPTLATATAHNHGSVVKTADGTIWFITAENQRRPFSSAGAFLSYGYLSWAQVVEANPDDLALPVGALIPPQDGKIFCATETRGTDVKGECALITNGQKAAFTRADVLTGLGFSFSRASYGDSSFLTKTANIDSVTEAHRPGVLINNNGTISLVGSAGLLGIPSMDVFYSWGYTLADVVPANNADRLQTQSGVMPGRVAGQLNPPAGGSLLNEVLILQDYIDDYPPLPTGRISSPADAEAVSTLSNQVNAADTFAEVYPYLSAKSIEVFSKLPLLIATLDASQDELYLSEYEDSEVTILSGAQFALGTQTVRQDLTGYSTSQDLVFTKENGAWKLDLLGTLAHENNNPAGVDVTGSGKTDLSIEGMEYETEPVTINSPGTRFLVQIKNNGRTTIHRFALGLEINGSEVYQEDITYRLKPGEEYILSVPINKYWTLPSVTKIPGEYRTDLWISTPTTPDTSPEDNTYYTKTEFIY